jgi:hypothetical protein
MFIRQHSNNQALLIKKNRERDLLAIRRILITNIVLIVVLLPPLVLMMMAFITGEDRSIDHRIQMLSYSVSMAVLCVEIVFVTPQLKTIILRMWQRNRIVPMHANDAGPVQLQPVATIG